MRLTAVGIVAATAFAGCAAPATQTVATAQSGERVFQKCFACHSVRPGETGLSGPNLHGVIGRRIAAQPDFDYSPAMIAFAQREEVWTEDLLVRFVADPESLVPGTDMFVPPITDPGEREALIAYLRSN